jgi:Uma2 family endonuclease
MVRNDDLMTAEELLLMQPLHMRSELINGRMIVREPGAYRHGRLAMAIGAALQAHVAPRGLGDVVSAETGFTLRRNPDTVRAPDAAFISNARLPRGDVSGFAELTPDLVVEVLSPSDMAGEVRAKVADWLSAGARLVWVVDAERGRADVYRADGTSDRVAAGGALDGEDVLPGFTLPLQPLFGA